MAGGVQRIRRYAAEFAARPTAKTRERTAACACPWLVVLCGLWFTSWVQAQSNEPPMTYRIAAEKTLVRSGPGREYYATDVLTEGQLVVVRQAQDDWLGIDPPHGSFDWIDREAVQWQPGDKQARVTQPQVPVWIGSNLVPIDRHVHRRKLIAGEVVRVISHVAITDTPFNARSQTWLKIFPPDGDLRWIERKDAVAVPAQRVDRVSAPDDTSDEVSDFSSSERQRSNDPVASDWVAVGGWQTRSGQPNTEAGSILAAGPKSLRAGGSPEEVGQAPLEESFDDALTHLVLSLSRAAVRRASSHEIEPLVRQAEQLVVLAQTTHQRSESRRLVDEAKKLRAWAQERERIESDIAALPEAPAERAVVRGLRSDLADASGPGRDRDILSNERPSPYVAEGWLMPVTRVGSAAPPFVVMNDEGERLAFVTPIPGLNLRRYIDQRVGIVGETSFPVLGYPHVVAHRAVLLERHVPNPRLTESTDQDN